MDVFDRYAPFIQDFIYRSGWQSLRAVQNAAGDAIFNTEENVLLTASTASGKTAAAFFPILSLFDRLSPHSISSAANILLIAAAVMPFRFFNTINVVGVLRAGGDTVFSMALDAGSVWVIGVPCVALATVALGWPIEGVFAASFLEEVLKLAVGLPRFMSGKWINNLTAIGAREEQA